MIRVNIWDADLCLETEETLFSPKGPDEGTMAMLSLVNLKQDDKVMDLGCGYGIVGIAVAKVIGDQNVSMVDIDLKAVEISKLNAASNGVPSIKILCGNGVSTFNDLDFSLILSNPPYHVNFSVPKEFIESGFRALKIGGKMVMVVKRLDWYKNKLTSVFGGVKILEIDGYYVLTAEKRNLVNVKIKARKTTKKHEKRMAQSNKR